MGRWTQYDEDEYRLPEGMKRIGYDADSGCYYFRDRSGAVWQGAEGAEFSEMTQVSSGSSTHYASDDDLEAAPRTRSDGYQSLAQDSHRSSEITPTTSPYRTLFPFFLMIAVVLLLVWRLIVSPIVLGPGPGSGDSCSAKGMKNYWVQPGDTCWEIARAHGCTLDQLKEANKAVECKLLTPGTTVCLPAPVAGDDKKTALASKKKRRPL